MSSSPAHSVKTASELPCTQFRKVFVDWFLISHAASDLYVPKLALRQLIAEQLTDYVRSLGVDVQLGQIVKAIEHPEGDKYPSDDTLRLLVGEDWQSFDSVIIATPAHAMAKLLHTMSETSLTELATRLEQVPYSPITGVHLWFDRPVMSLPHAVCLGSLTQWAFRSPWFDSRNIIFRL